MTDLSGEQLREAVARAREPKPPVPTGDKENHDAMMRWFSGDPAKSPRGAWTLAYIYDHGDVPEWIAPAYEAEISAAWALVEEMGEHGARPRLRHTDGGWDADADLNHRIHGFHCDTAPEAICRLYLAWKRAQVVDDVIRRTSERNRNVFRKLAQ